MVDAKRWDTEFQERDLVFLKLQQYQPQSIFKKAYKKLANMFNGPSKLRDGWQDDLQAQASKGVSCSSGLLYFFVKKEVRRDK